MTEKYLEINPSRQSISVSEWIIKCVGHWSPNAYVHHSFLLLVELPADSPFGLKF